MPRRAEKIPKKPGRKPRIGPRDLQVLNAYMTNGYVKAKAMLAGGFSPSTPPGQVFNKPLVKAELQRRLDELHNTLQEKYNIDKEWIEHQYARMVVAGRILAKFKKIGEDGAPYWDFTEATEEELSLFDGMTVETYKEGRGESAREVKKVKIDLPDRKGALDSLARTHGLFQDKVEITGHLSVAARLIEARKRVNQIIDGDFKDVTPTVEKADG